MGSNIKGLFLPSKKLKKMGFDFDFYKYKAELFKVNEKGEEEVIGSLRVVGEMAYSLNRTGDTVFIVSLKENPDWKLRRVFDKEEIRMN